MRLTFVLDKLLRKSPTYVLVDRARSSPDKARGIRASLGKRAAATCEHMIVDGRTRYPYYYPLHGRPVKRTTRTTRRPGPPSPSRYHMRRRRVVHRHAVSYAGRMHATGSDMGGDATKIHRPVTLRCAAVCQSPARRKGLAMPMRRSYQVTNLGMHACRSLS